MAGKRWKSYCDHRICPTDCCSLHFIASANRMCYDDKYTLPQEKTQIRYKETIRGPINADEFEKIEIKLDLPKKSIYKKLIEIGYLDKSGKIISSQACIRYSGIKIGEHDITQATITKLNNRGKTHIVATGIISHSNHGINQNNTDGVYENNLNLIKPSSNDHYSYCVKEACRALKINYDKLITEIQTISNEINESEVIEYEIEATRQ